MDSILTSVKKLLGIAEEYEQFDADLILHINSVFMVLHQLGVGPEEGYAITDKYDVWSDFTSDVLKLNSIKSYMYLKVRLLFDPPLTGSVMEAMKEQIAELEWRLNVAVDPSDMPVEVSEEDDRD